MSTTRLAFGSALRFTTRLARQPLVALGLAILFGPAGAGCGGSKPADAAPNPRPNAAGPEATADSNVLPSWQREAIPMPATFTGFPRPNLGDLDGVWLVDGPRARTQEVWLFEDQGSKLTVVTAQGDEQIHGVTLSSPCALRLTDAEGETQSRAIAQLVPAGGSGGGRLILTPKGAVAVAAKDGSLLACVGHRTYQVTPDGLCRFTTEMLGVWADPVEAEGSCVLEPGSREGTGEDKRLIIAGQTLREVEPGIWLDELAEASVVTPADSREAALAALQPEAGDDETGGETGDATGDATGDETGDATGDVALP